MVCVLNPNKYLHNPQFNTDIDFYLVSELGTYWEIFHYLTHIHIDRNLLVTNLTPYAR